MWIAGNDPFAPHEAEEEAQHDLANTVAFSLIEQGDLVEPEPVDILRDEHTSGRKICANAGDANLRMASEKPHESTLVLRLDLVVELVSDPLAHLVQQRSGVATRRQPLQDRAHEPDVTQIASDRIGDIRVLDLTATCSPSTVRAR